MNIIKTISVASSLLVASLLSQAQQMPQIISEKSKLGQSILRKTDFNPNFSVFPNKTTNKVARTTADSFSRPIGYMSKYYSSGNWEINDSLFITWKGDHAKNINLFDYNRFGANSFDPKNYLNYLEFYADQLVYNRSIDSVPKVIATYELYNDGALEEYTTEYHYDANEKLVKAIINNTDSITYTYDNNGKIITQKVYYGNDIDTDSVTYDANGNVTNFYSWYTNSNLYHYSYDYDSSNKLVRKVYQYYNNNNVLNGGTIDSIFYPSSTVDSHVLYYNWSNNWEIDDFVIVTKNSNGQNIKFELLDATSLDQSFVGYIEHNATGLGKKIYYVEGLDTFEIVDVTLDASGNVLELYVDNRYNSNFTMQKYSKHVATYNEENLPLKVNAQFTYNDSTNTWDEGDYDKELVIYYEKHGIEDTTSSITNILNSSIKLYPNPTQDQLHIEVANETINAIIIYDAMGRMSRSYQIPNKTGYEINVASLPSGNYIMQIKTNKGIANTKFTKE